MDPVFIKSYFCYCGKPTAGWKMLYTTAQQARQGSSDITWWDCHVATMHPICYFITTMPMWCYTSRLSAQHQWGDFSECGEEIRISSWQRDLLWVFGVLLTSQSMSLPLCHCDYRTRGQNDVNGFIGLHGWNAIHWISSTERPFVKCFGTLGNAASQTKTTGADSEFTNLQIKGRPNTMQSFVSELELSTNVLQSL